VHNADEKTINGGVGIEDLPDSKHNLVSINEGRDKSNTVVSLYILELSSIVRFHFRIGKSEDGIKYRNSCLHFDLK
jgi:hypothetical protein